MSGGATGDAGRRRILHFAETLYGGIATYLNELLAHQVACDDDVRLFCPVDQQHLIRVAGVKFVPAPPVSRSLKGLVGLARCWKAHHGQNVYDIVHLHSSFAGGIGRLFKPKAGIVYCAHGWSFAMDVAGWKKGLYAMIERGLAYRTDAIVNISFDDHALADAVGIPRKRSHVIHNGLGDIPWRSLPAGQRATRMLFVGRYDRQKGFDLLLKAMENLSNQGFTLTSIGGPVVGAPQLPPFPDQVANRGWQSPDQVHSAIDAADVIVMPSRWEGFGLVAVEAMRAGRPVIAARIGGLKEVVVDGETGVLHEPNSVQEIIAACLRLRDMDAAQLGRNGRGRYEKLFTSELMAGRVDALYRSLPDRDQASKATL